MDALQELGWVLFVLGIPALIAWAMGHRTERRVRDEEWRIIHFVRDEHLQRSKDDRIFDTIEEARHDFA